MYCRQNRPSVFPGRAIAYGCGVTRVVFMICRLKALIHSISRHLCGSATAIRKQLIMLVPCRSLRTSTQTILFWGNKYSQNQNVRKVVGLGAKMYSSKIFAGAQAALPITIESVKFIVHRFSSQVTTRTKAMDNLM